jgi:hypothetical protein
MYYDNSPVNPNVFGSFSSALAARIRVKAKLDVTAQNTKMYFVNVSWNPLYIYFRPGRLHFVKKFNIAVPYHCAYHLIVT